ncbi:unnamed protein product [Mesocestoides corti]|uniref:FCH and double SH3 domains 2 n=1 Tax=Mesocestoides corti TaxID=53468 RepID=A0A0R3UI52_MESCO|nr:unnamed protein product [Mesocestoides corti]
MPPSLLPRLPGYSECVLPPPPPFPGSDPPPRRRFYSAPGKLFDSTAPPATPFSPRPPTEENRRQGCGSIHSQDSLPPDYSTLEAPPNTLFKTPATQP